MDLSKQAIEEFKAIYKKEYGESISDDRAQELGQNLLTLFRVLCERTLEDDVKDKCKEDIKGNV